MAKALLIVESPAKARTIKKYVGRDYLVKASVGHIKDLPKKTIGVDVKHGFRPEYVVLEKKEKVLADIMKAAKSVEKVYLAPDPDREGEAIAWHIASELQNGKKNIFRVLLHEITKKGVQKGLANPVPLDEHKFESQQARRILDRLVGYEVSPVLWKKIRRGLSAGRVQSVALRLIVEREREILAFVPQEYWVISADLEGASPPVFTAVLSKIDGEKAEVKDEARASEIVEALRAAALTVGSVERKERRRHPPPPYVTAKLQQDASQRFGFGAKRTMRAAQGLYEGVELPDEGAVGLITYMRTDSTRISDDAIAEVRAFIPERYGAEALPEEPRIFKTKKSAQDAHEAIRPTSMAFPPDRVVAHLEPDQAKVYTMVWQRFVASQMTAAVYDATGVDVVEPSGKYTLRATGQILKEPGYLAVYGVSLDVDDEEAADSAGKRLPELAEGEALRLTGAGARGEQKFTQPPARFTEGTLVKEMEEKGIGRPSTYASILSTIQDRTYVEKIDGGKLKPTELGLIVNDKLVRHFPVILDIEFTAQMEEGLDLVEEGTKDWKLLLQQFYKPFHATVVKADKEMEVVKAREVPTEHVCDKCGKPMVRKWGRMGSFLACTGYPDCRNTKQLERQDDGTFKVIERPQIDVKCETCGREMAVKQGRFGEFLACTGYPKDCEATRPMPIGVRCPKCGSEVVKRRSKKGKTFWGCLSWAKTGCDFVLWDKPMPIPCPQCGAKFLVQAGRRVSAGLRCVTEGCGYRKAGEEE